MDTPHESPAEKPTTRRWFALAAVLAVLVTGFFVFRSPEPQTESAPEATAADAVSPNDTTSAVEARPTPRAPTSTAAVAAAPDEHEGHDHDRHPHPISPEHVRIQNDNQMLGALNDATDIKDPRRLRQLIEVWKERHDDDPEKYAEAYTVIADCLEFPGDESRAKARRFYDENRASTLRRHIRRHCF